MVSNTGRSPLKKVRSGRFQISTWKFQRLLNSGDSESVAYVEKWVDVDRACIQHSTYNRTTRQWENQSIWAFVDDLRDLREVLEKL